MHQGKHKAQICVVLANFGKYWQHTVQGGNGAETQALLAPVLTHLQIVCASAQAQAKFVSVARAQAGLASVHAQAKPILVLTSFME